MTRRAAGGEDLADVAGGAEVAVTIDDAGDVARIELTTPRADQRSRWPSTSRDWAIPT